eukprot:1717558-Rhodomonas_salina.3
MFRFSISSRRSVNLGAANGVRGIVGLKVAISAGRGGTKGLALGVKIDEALRTADNKVILNMHAFFDSRI